MSDKLGINNEMAQLDTKNRGFYDELNEEERKKFSTFLMIRYGSSVQGSRDLQEFYVISCNERLNKHFFALHKHPKLQWLMATTVSPDMGTPRHTWIAPKKKEAGASAKRKAIEEMYPHAKDDEIDLLCKLVSNAEIKQYQQSKGQE